MRAVGAARFLALGHGGVYVERADGVITEVRLHGPGGRLREWRDAARLAFLDDPPRLAVVRIALGGATPTVEIVDVPSGEPSAIVAHEAIGALAWEPGGEALWLQLGGDMVALDAAGSERVRTAAPVLRGARRLVFAARPHDHDGGRRAVSCAGGAGPTAAFLAWAAFDRGGVRVLAHIEGSALDIAASADLSRAYTWDDAGRLTAWHFDADQPVGRRLDGKRIAHAWCDVEGGALFAQRGDTIVDERDGRLERVCAELARGGTRTRLEVDAGARLAAELVHGGARLFDLERRAHLDVPDATALALAHARAFFIVRGALFVSDARTERAPRLVEGPIDLVDVAGHESGVLVVDAAGRTRHVAHEELRA